MCVLKISVVKFNKGGSYMSFQLLFFKPKTRKIELYKVLDFFQDKPHFTTKSLSEGYHRFIYQNETTKVSFMITYNETDELITDLTFDHFFEFCYTSFSLNFMRPSYYALEAMPIIYEFCKKFDLYINDAQHLSEEKNTLKQYTVEELVQSYEKNNEIVSKEFNKQSPLLNTTKEKSLYYYEYIKNHDQCSKSYSVTVPQLGLMEKKNTTELFTVIAWYNADTILIPKCDYLFIIKEVKGFLGMKKQSTSIISFDTFINTFQPHLKTIHKDLYLLDKVTPKVKELFYDITDESSEEFEITDEPFVDVTLT